jgi:hypothetical protein
MKISVYMDFGTVFSYEVSDIAKAREHVSAIVATGYRHTPTDSADLEWFPPSRILKVKIEGGGESSAYHDTARAT